MNARHLERLAAIAAVACGVGFGLDVLRANWSALRPRSEPARLECAAPPVVGTMRVGERRAVAVELANPSDDPRRVVGVGRMCGLHACYEGLAEPVTIPPRGTGTVRVEVKAMSVGPIRDLVTFYTDRGNLGEMDVAFAGQVLPAGATP